MRTRPSNRARLTVESLESRWNPTTETVTNFNADGVGSLAAAVAIINLSEDPNNQINFGPNAQQGDIYLTQELTVSKNVAITGPGTGVGGTVTVHGTRGQANPFVAGKRVFSLTGGKTLEINNLSIMDGGTNADTDINGGLIKVDTGYLILRNSLVSGGIAKGDGGGIWIGSGGKLELHGTNVWQNTALGNGGGVAVAGGASVIIRGYPYATQTTWSNISLNEAGNDGGGLYITGAGNVTMPPAVDIQKTYISGNRADGGFGGGAYIGWAGNTTANKPVQIQYTEVTDNYALFNGGGIYLGVGAHTKFGAGVKVNENKSKQKEGIGIDHANATNIDGRDNVEQKNNRYLPPPGGDGSTPSSHYVDPGSTFDFAGVVDMTPGAPAPAGSIAAITFRNAGTVIPGGSGGIGLITLMGSYDQTGTGALNIDLADAGYDQLAVTAPGTLVSLAGALNLNPTWSVAPAAGTKFTIISNGTAAATAGNFDGLPDGTILAVGGVLLQITYNRPSTDALGNPQDPNDVVLEVVGGSGGSGGTIRGLAWTDAGADGIRDNGEGGLGGVPVFLFDGPGNQLASTETDLNGNSAFHGLGEGTYYVEFVTPGGYALAPKDQGTDDTTDSDADQPTGDTDTFALSFGQTIDHLDAGFYFVGSGGSG